MGHGHRSRAGQSARSVTNETAWRATAKPSFHTYADENSVGGNRMESCHIEEPIDFESKESEMRDRPSAHVDHDG